MIRFLSKQPKFDLFFFISARYFIDQWGVSASIFRFKRSRPSCLFISRSLLWSRLFLSRSLPSSDWKCTASRRCHNEKMNSKTWEYKWSSWDVRHGYLERRYLLALKIWLDSVKRNARMIRCLGRFQMLIILTETEECPVYCCNKTLLADTSGCFQRDNRRQRTDWQVLVSRRTLALA